MNNELTSGKTGRLGGYTNMRVHTRAPNRYDMNCATSKYDVLHFNWRKIDTRDLTKFKEHYQLWYPGLQPED
eukprot:scaffold1314_cov158-Amphora_coffeaeformis.AAC.6